jgi:hypothetical protein
MPTPDASAFVRQKKLNALSQREINTTTLGVKPLTHLYQYVPLTAGIRDFLPSFTNKFVRPYTLTRINTTVPPPKTSLTYYGAPYIR